MFSLRNFLTSTLESDALLSLRDGALQLGFDGAFSLLEIMAAFEADTDGPFTPLPLQTEGAGAYRADRFRIYFTVDGMGTINVVQDFRKFVSLFPQFVNGFGGDIDHVEGLEQNQATVFFRSDKSVWGEPSLRFQFDARVLFQFIDIADLHDDWVGIIQQEGDNFAVQTLKRNFVQSNDVIFGVAVAEALGALGASAGGAVAGPLGAMAGAHPLLVLGEGVTTASVNRYHFLAGRRSWRLGKLPTFEADNLPGSQGNIYYLETATINRFSSWLVKFFTLFGDVGIGDIEETVHALWTIQLRNWGAYGIEELGYRTDTSAWRDEIDELTHGIMPNRHRNVYSNVGTFETLNDALAQPWVQEMLGDHPILADQF